MKLSLLKGAKDSIINSPAYDKPKVVRKTKIETTYEYKPIIGEILGYWRKVEVCKAGEAIEVHLNHTLEGYDRIIVNGELIAFKNEIGKLTLADEFLKRFK